MEDNIVLRIGAIVSLIAILFLPFVGCGDATINGLQILKSDDIALSYKLLIVICIFSALAVFLVREPHIITIAGGIGLISLIAAFLIARNQIPIDLKSGAYIALFGFLLAIGEGVSLAKRKNTEQNMEPP